MRRTIVVVLVMAALASSAAAVLYYEDKHRPIPQHEYAKVELSNSKDEVKYRLGVPDNVIEDYCTKDEFGCNYRLYIVDGHDHKNSIPVGKTFGDYDWWTYSQKLADGTETGYVQIEFDRTNKKVSAVSCFAIATDNPFVCDIIAYSKGKKDLITIGMTEDELKKKLGEPTTEELEHNSPSKTIAYKNVNLEFWLVKQKIYRIAVKIL